MQVYHFPYVDESYPGNVRIEWSSGEIKVEFIRECDESAILVCEIAKAKLVVDLKSLASNQDGDTPRPIRRCDVLQEKQLEILDRVNKAELVWDRQDGIKKIRLVYEEISSESC